MTKTLHADRPRTAHGNVLVRGYEVMAGNSSAECVYAAQMCVESLEAEPADADLSRWTGWHRYQMPPFGREIPIRNLVYVYLAGTCPPARIVRSVSLTPVACEVWHEPPYESRPCVCRDDDRPPPMPTAKRVTCSAPATEEAEPSSLDQAT